MVVIVREISGYILGGKAIIDNVVDGLDVKGFFDLSVWCDEEVDNYEGGYREV